ncbi:hypothetical protein B0O99DRAFT_663916 [Bisporella sp. PMI_857]|nr:hypothetical protein B0O99DRAFT_663916 [Bisporella sp. PMI_857]
MAIANRITKIAIVGAGGNVGSFITAALLKTGKHTITAITRLDSQSKLPEGVISKKVDYSKQETLVDALRGQDALVITLSALTPKETDMQLINAAAEAGVPWVLPNEWGPDNTNEDLVRDVFPFQPKVTIRNTIADLGKSSYIAVSTGFWYEWSLAIPGAFGVDFANRTATLFDEGETKVSISTWPQVGRAVAALLSLPIAPEGPNKEAFLNNFKNKVVYINSFTVSQKDMLDSVLRVTGTKEGDWRVSKELSRERHTKGIQEMQEGKRIGFMKMMYARVFYPDDCGDFEHKKGTLNGLLNLPTEDIDEATKAAMERSKAAN